MEKKVIVFGLFLILLIGTVQASPGSDFIKQLLGIEDGVQLAPILEVPEDTILPILDIKINRIKNILKDYARNHPIKSVGLEFIWADWVFKGREYALIENTPDLSGMKEITIAVYAEEDNLRKINENELVYEYTPARDSRVLLAKGHLEGDSTNNYALWIDKEQFLHFNLVTTSGSSTLISDEPLAILPEHEVFLHEETSIFRIIATYDGKTMNLYRTRLSTPLSGARAEIIHLGSKPNSGSIINSEYPLVIGAKETSSQNIRKHFNGTINNLAIFEKGFTKEQIVDYTFGLYPRTCGNSRELVNIQGRTSTFKEFKKVDGFTEACGEEIYQYRLLRNDEFINPIGGRSTETDEVKICTDSDGGHNKFEQGTVRYYTTEGGWIEKTDSCNAGSVIEWNCQNDPQKEAIAQRDSCADGEKCSNGQCMPTADIFPLKDCKDRSPVVTLTEGDTTTTFAGPLHYIIEVLTVASRPGRASFKVRGLEITPLTGVNVEATLTDGTVIIPVSVTPATSESRAKVQYYICPSETSIPDDPPVTPLPPNTQGPSCQDFGYESGTVGKCCDDSCNRYDLGACYNTNPYCEDQDKGQDYYTSSKVITGIATEHGISCNGGSSGGGSALPHKDRCEGNSLIEQRCSVDGERRVTGEFPCPEGCSDGACNIPKESACLDSDEEDDPFVVGVILAKVGKKYDYCSKDKTQAIQRSCDPDNDGEIIKAPTDCEHGCLGGICLDKAVSCSENDHDRPLRTKGTTCLNGKCKTDICVDSKQLKEFSIKEQYVINENTCTSNAKIKVLYPYHDCTFGCLDGACQKGEKGSEVCEELIDYLSTEDEILPGYIRALQNTYTRDSVDVYGEEIQITEVEYTNLELDKFINIGHFQIKDSTKLVQNSQSFKDFVNKENPSKITLGRNNEQQGLALQSEHFTSIVWYNKNTATIISIDHDQRVGEETINEPKTEIIDLSTEEYRSLRTIADNLITHCPSTFTNNRKDDEQCIPEWEHRVQPVECPASGVQIVNSIDKNYCPALEGEGVSLTSSEQQCETGTCSGCSVNPYSGYVTGTDATCVPYGTRLTAQRSDSPERIKVGEFNDYTLTCISETAAELAIHDPRLSETLTVIKEGTIIEIPTNVDSDFLQIKITEVSCASTNNEDNYIMVQGLFEENGYCSINGHIKSQINNGAIKACQNSYECASNLCSNNRCIDIQEIIEENRGFRNWVSRALCRLLNPLNDETYNACVIEAFGA